MEPTMPPPPPPTGGGEPPPGYQAYNQYGAAPQYAGFGSRLGAYFIDGLIGGLFSLPAIIAIFAGPKHIDECTIDGRDRLCEVPDNSTIAIAVVLGVAAFVAYLVIYTRMVGKGQSWGQKAVGIRVVDADTGQPIGTGRAVGRYFGRLISGAICYLGFLWMLWDSRKQTWHDKMVNSIVVRS